MSIAVNNNPPPGLRDEPISCRYCFIPLLFSNIPMRCPNIAKASNSLRRGIVSLSFSSLIATGRISEEETGKAFTCRKIAAKLILPGVTS